MFTRVAWVNRATEDKMAFKDTIGLIKSDFERYSRENDGRPYLRVLLGTPPIWLLIAYRARRHFRYESRLPIIRQVACAALAVLQNILRLMTCIEISPAVKIGKGFYMPHMGCIVIHHNCVFGDYCTVLQGVTAGNSGLKDKERAPKFGSNVMIGAGAKVIGGITIGDDVTIGANAVVTKDVPPGVVVAGVPARIIRRQDQADASMVKKDLG